MEINFIKHLSDEVITENHALRAQIVQLRKDLKSYEEAMIPQLPLSTTIYDSPFDCFKAFLRLHRTLLAEKQSLEESILRQKRQQIYLLGSMERIQDGLSAKEKESGALKEELEAQRENLQRLERTRKEEEAKARKEAVRLGEQLRECQEDHRRKQLKLQEQMAQKVEEVRAYHNRQLMEYRDRVEQESVKTELLLKQQICTKDRQVKDILSALQTQELSLASQEAFQTIFRPFLEYSAHNNTLQSLREENAGLKAIVREKEAEALVLESDLAKRRSLEEVHLRRQERLSMEKGEIEKKLLDCLKIVAKAERDQETTEKYYLEKWESQLRKVKKTLQANYVRKGDELERSHRAELKKCQATIEYNQQFKIQLELQLAQGASKIAEAQKHCLALQAETAQAIEQRHELAKLLMEREAMARQDTLEYQIVRQEERQWQSKIKEGLKQEIEALRKQMLVRDLRRNEQIREFQIAVQCDLERKEKEHEETIAEINAKHEQVLRLLGLREEEMQEQMKERERLIERQYEVRVQQKEKDFMARIADIQVEHKLKMQKNQGRLKEEVTKINKLRKVHEQEKETLLKECNELQKDKAKLKENQAHYESVIQHGENVKRQYQALIRKEQDTVRQLKAEVAQLTDNVKKANFMLIDREEQIKKWKKQREEWGQELQRAEMNLRKQFFQLRKVHETEVFHLRSKVWELEDIASRKFISKKDYDHIQQLVLQKKKLLEAIHVQQAEKVIVEQVRDYYEVKCRQTEDNFMRTQFQPILVRNPHKHTPKRDSAKIFEPSVVTEMRRYILKSGEKKKKAEDTPEIIELPFPAGNTPGRLQKRFIRFHSSMA